jgi:hypothetical protein
MSDPKSQCRYQHRRRQLLRGNGREWFLERGCRFCNRIVVSQTERTKWIYT